MASEGKTDLKDLIRSMKPSLSPETFVFGHIPTKTDVDSYNVLKLLSGLPVQMLFKEVEGWTAIMEQTEAEAIQLKSTFLCKKITLNVHSSLDAVGFLAAITTELTKLDIGCNPVSGYFHDHLFVPEGKESVVMETLEHMAAEA